jgi:hypothetical protein
MALTPQLFGAVQDISTMPSIGKLSTVTVYRDIQAFGVHMAVRASITERRVGRGREVYAWLLPEFLT